ncbi:MAG: hypothetical protein AAFX10_00075 [Pseudomonadota bacterium]
MASTLLRVLLSLFVLVGLAPAALAVPIGSGDRIQGTIVTTGDIDTFTFLVNAGDQIRFSVGIDSGVNLDPSLTLRDPNGVQVASGSGAASTNVTHTALLSGTYVVEVGDRSTIPDGTGTYTVFYARVPGSFVVPGGDEGGTLQNGDVHPGVIDLADMDTWSFEADAGDAIRLGLAEVGGSGLSPFMLLYGPDGATITTGFGTSSTAISHNVSVAGTYTLIVQDGNTNVTGTGSYNLYFARSAETFVVPPGDEGGALTNGGVVSGDIDLGDIDIWTFDAEVGENIRIGLGEPGSPTSLRPFILLYGPDGVSISSSSGTDTTVLSHEVAVGGTYTLFVQDGNTNVTGTGSYDLYFAQSAEAFIVPAGDDGGVLSNGDRVSGNIDVTDIDLWTFEASVGDTIRLGVADTGGASLSPFIVLYGPDGGSLASGFGTSATALSYEATVGGAYTVMMLDGNTNATGTGSYNLYFALTANPFIVPVGDEGGALSSGEIATGDIELADIDVWSFDADAGDTIRFGIGETASTSFRPFMLLYGPDGRIISSASGTSSTALSYQAAIGGSHTLLVLDGNTNVTGTGSYNLYYARTAEPLAVPVGDEGGSLVSGAADSGSIDLADIDVWTVQADAGDTIQLDVTETGAGNNFSPLVLLYGPDGTNIGSGFGANVATLTRAASIGGLHSVFVVDGNSGATGTGDYDISLTRTPGGASVPPGAVISTLSNGDVAAGALNGAGVIAKYGLPVAAGEQVQLQLADLTGSNSITLTLQVFDAAGGLVASAASNTVAAVRFPVTASETLTVVASQNSALIADYALYSTRASQSFTVPSGDEGGSLSSGDVATGTLTLGDIDHYSIGLAAGQALRLRLADLSGSNSVTGVVRLFDANGGLLASSASNTVADLTYYSQQTETVLVEVYKSGVFDANYALYSSVASGPFTTPTGDEGGSVADLDPLVDGAVTPGLLTLGDIDLYEVEVTSDERLRLRLADLSLSNSVTAELRLYGSDGTLLARSSSNTVPEVAYTATADETLQVEVSKQGVPDANYELFTTVASDTFTTPSGDEGGTLNNGGVSRGQLTLADIDLFSLHVDAGDKLRLRLADLSLNNSVTAVVRLYGSDSSYLGFASSNTVAGINYVADKSETLRVEVSKTGDPDAMYELYTAVGTDGFVIPAGDEGGVLQNGVTENGAWSLGDIDLYAFAAPLGSTVTVQLDDLSGNNSVTAAFALYDSSGNLLGTGSSNTSATLSYVARASEPIMLHVFKTGSPPATYAVTVNGIAVLDQDIDTLDDATELILGTDFNDSDTDDDGLTDGEEVNTYGTDPLNEDTDGDGGTDGEEVAAGSDPLDPEVRVPLPLWALLLLAAGLGAIGARRQRRLAA